MWAFPSITELSIHIGFQQISIDDLFESCKKLKEGLSIDRQELSHILSQKLTLQNAYIDTKPAKSNIQNTLKTKSARSSKDTKNIESKTKIFNQRYQPTIRTHRYIETDPHKLDLKSDFKNKSNLKRINIFQVSDIDLMREYQWKYLASSHGGFSVVIFVTDDSRLCERSGRFHRTFGGK